MAPRTKDDPFEGVLLSETVVAALQLAAMRRPSATVLGTTEALIALSDCDSDPSWSRIELHTRLVSQIDARRYPDRPPDLVGGHWQGVPLTEALARALGLAAKLATTYLLIPLPPGLFALALLSDHRQGATAALLFEADIEHGTLIQLVEDVLLDAELEGLEQYIQTPATDAWAPPTPPSEPPVPLESDDYLEQLLRRAAQSYPGSIFSNDPSVLVTTAHIALTLIDMEQSVWTTATAGAGMDFRGYRKLLIALARQPAERPAAAPLDTDELRLVGINLSRQLDEALRALTYLTDFKAVRDGVTKSALLGVVLLATQSADARASLSADDLGRLQQELARPHVGVDIDVFRSQVAEATCRTRRAQPTSPSGDGEPAHRNLLGFKIGTLLGALVLSAFAGVGVAIALLISSAVFRLRSRRPGRGRRSQAILQRAGAVAVAGAVVLVATGTWSFGETRQAVRWLRTGVEQLHQDDKVLAMSSLARARLLEPGSVRASLLGACIDWDLRFRDQALAELQRAFWLGYRAGERSHYEGSRCFVDRFPFLPYGLLPEKIGTSWLVYPVIHRDDLVSKRYLEIAKEAQAKDDPADKFIALACLADRYDLRMLAAFYFTVGLNLKMGATPYSELHTCLVAESVSTAYAFRRAPSSEAEAFFPKDFGTRVPSPQRSEPPDDACWARYPEGGPCHDHS